MSKPVRLQPVGQYGLPDYPTRDKFNSAGEPLEQHWPDAWKYGKAFLKGLIVAAGLNAAGCSSGMVDGNRVPAVADQALDAGADPFADGTFAVSMQFPHPLVTRAAEWTREIYDDGQWVALGCIAFMPPVGTSEDESPFDGEFWDDVDSEMGQSSPD